MDAASRPIAPASPPARHHSPAAREPSWVDQRFSQWKQEPYLPHALRRVIRDLEDYYHQPIQAIADRYWQLREREGGTVDPSATVVDHYYHTVDRYVYESTYFEAFAEYQQYFATVKRACAQFARAPVLDFGGGAGGFTLALASAGIACDYADIPGPTSTYARWRLARYDCVATLLDATQPLPRARYQAIVTLDVFEHLPDLPGTLRELARALVPGGWLISESTFNAGDPLHLPQNLVYADFQRFSGLLAHFGLTYRGRLRPDPLSEQWFAWFHRPQVFRIWLDPKPKIGGRFIVHELAGSSPD